jgi:hypothetical protein
MSNYSRCWTVFRLALAKKDKEVIPWQQKTGQIPLLQENKLEQVNCPANQSMNLKIKLGSLNNSSVRKFTIDCDYV